MHDKKRGDMILKADDDIQPIQSAFLMTDRRQAFLNGLENTNHIKSLCKSHPNGMLSAFTNRSIACLNLDYFDVNILP